MMRQLWINKRDGVISLLLLIAVLLFAFALLLSPVLNQVERYRTELAKDARILQQLRAIDNARDTLQSTFEEYQSRDLQSWVYSQTRPDTATLDIQRRVSAELTSAAAQVRSISPLPVKTQDGYSIVGVQVNFTASMPALMEALNALEQDKPLLVIENARISPVRQRRRRGEVAEQLVSVQMTVLTFLVSDTNEGVMQ
ncbi:MAG TPA: type II secretion system protein GspM [Thiopseudomonas sp.]|nr:type II secretion system protein GspM [Thiopseudomonas sp.]